MKKEMPALSPAFPHVQVYLEELTGYRRPRPPVLPCEEDPDEELEEDPDDEREEDPDELGREAEPPEIRDTPPPELVDVPLRGLEMAGVLEDPLRLPDEEPTVEEEREDEESGRAPLPRESEPDRLEAPRPLDTEPRLSEPREVPASLSR
jgi:hypothetical protein